MINGEHSKVPSHVTIMLCSLTMPHIMPPISIPLLARLVHILFILFTASDYFMQISISITSTTALHEVQDFRLKKKMVMFCKSGKSTPSYPKLL